MAIVTVRDRDQELTDAGEIGDFLEQFGIWYRRFDGCAGLEEGASDEDVLAACDEPIQKLMAEGGYRTADVVHITPETPDEMLAKFDKEHLHTEDEVRFVLDGRGIFDIRARDERWMRVVVEAGDLIVVPKDRYHRFELTAEKSIRCVRLFQDPAGWTPHYRAADDEAGQ